MGLPFIKNADVVAYMAKHLEKTSATITDVKHLNFFYGGPELDSIALSYLLCSDVFLLGIIIQVFGPPKKGKTTVVADLLRRYFADIGATATMIETENKANNRLLEDLFRGRKIPVIRTTEQEEAQQAIMSALDFVKAQTLGSKADTSHPTMHGVGMDSFRVNCKGTNEAVASDGFAGRAFSAEALNWRRYLPSMNDSMRELPFTIMFVNHQTEKTDANGYTKTADSGGGEALKFLQTYQIQVTDGMGSKRTQSQEFRVLRLRTKENSNGPSGRVIFPRIVYRMDDDMRQYEGTYVDWQYADMLLLTGKDIPRQRLTDQGICNATLASDGMRINDTVMGLKCVSIAEYTEALKSDASRYKALQDELGIVRYKSLEELWEQGWFYASARKSRNVQEMAEFNKAPELADEVTVQSVMKKATRARKKEAVKDADNAELQ